MRHTSMSFDIDKPFFKKETKMKCNFMFYYLYCSQSQEVTEMFCFYFFMTQGILNCVTNLNISKICMANFSPYEKLLIVQIPGFRRALVNVTKPEATQDSYDLLPMFASSSPPNCTCLCEQGLLFYSRLSLTRQFHMS